MHTTHETTKLAAALHYGALAAQAAADRAPDPIHPALSRSIELSLSGAAAIRRQQYVEALRSHDWGYAWSDDHRVLVRGSAERHALRTMAAQLDPDFQLWNQHCQAQHRNGGAL